MSSASKAVGLREIKAMLAKEGASLVSCERIVRNFHVEYKINGQTFKAVMANPAKASWGNTRLMIAGIRANKRKAFVPGGNEVERLAPTGADLRRSRKSLSSVLQQAGAK
ncbi:hypothetical protein [Stenotrophomonas pigmentata]|uniref:hypothetical protein n=1 Tax=Stenotrophomonas pigmentata TaxID=3055080 RepID=UPI0026EDA5FD|nr:hypothetical protein [Stenotrophomonas sp. 610A2]